MQCQSPKPKKEPKKAAINSGNQKIKYKKPPLTGNRQQAQVNGTQPCSIHNNTTKRNQKNRRNRQWNRFNKKTANLKRRNTSNNCNRMKFQCTIPDAHSFGHAHSWEHANPRSYQTANQNRERNGYFCSARCTYG